jgi:hypothetical protein
MILINGPKAVAGMLYSTTVSSGDGCPNGCNNDLGKIGDCVELSLVDYVLRLIRVQVGYGYDTVKPRTDVGTAVV